MTEPGTSAWDRVGESFAELGRTMKEHFEHGPGGGTTPSSPAPPATTPEELAAAQAGGPTEASPEADEDQRGQDPLSALRDALDQIVAVGRDFGERASSFTRDEAIKAQAKHVATSLSNAVEATVDQIGREVGGWFKRPRTDPTVTGGEDALDATASDADDVTPLGDAEPPSAGTGGATVQASGPDRTEGAGDGDDMPPAAPV